MKEKINLRKKINVLSLFDGIACARQALDRAGFNVATYYAAEIHEPSILVAKTNYSDIIEVGDVRNLKGSDYKHIDMIVGGSPCQNFSLAGTRKGMSTISNVMVTTLKQYLHLKANGFVFQGESYLFWEFVRLVEEIREYNPNLIFLLENVKMKKQWEVIISDALGVEPYAINSSVMSAQNRPRFYWTNIDVNPIIDKNIGFNQIIPGAIAAGQRGIPTHATYGARYKAKRTMRKDNKSNCVVCSPHQTGRYMLNDEYLMITPEHAEQLQTIAIGYTKVDGVSATERYKMVGNAWTVDVIAHIFDSIK